MRPRIGITLDSEETGGYSKYPWYALRENYAGIISQEGGMPLPLPHEPELVEDYLEIIDGLLITGGAFDVDPALFGDALTHQTVKTKNRRTLFELAIVKGALERQIPILGICGGEQLLNVALGGSLIQHIPDFIPQALPHEQPNPRHEAGHLVRIEAGTLLAQITGAREIPVNSAHHQAVRDLAPGLKASAFAPDGVIEAIELPGAHFVLGVQWHPEFVISPADAAIIQAFIKACE